MLFNVSVWSHPGLFTTDSWIYIEKKHNAYHSTAGTHFKTTTLKCSLYYYVNHTYNEWMLNGRFRCRISLSGKSPYSSDRLSSLTSLAKWFIKVQALGYGKYSTKRSEQQGSDLPVLLKYRAEKSVCSVPDESMSERLEIGIHYLLTTAFIITEIGQWFGRR